MSQNKRLLTSTRKSNKTSPPAGGGEINKHRRVIHRMMTALLQKAGYKNECGKAVDPKGYAGLI
jgi:hypothetical protein